MSPRAPAMPALPAAPPPPPSPPMFGQDMPKKKGGATPQPTFLGGALAASQANVGQKTLLGQ